MATITVPVMAAFENDLRLNLGILEKNVLPKGHEIGLEIIGKPAHFLTSEGRAQMLSNLKKYAWGLKLISHQWSGNVIYDPSPKNFAFSDLRTERGSKVIEAGVEFAQEAIGMGLILGDQEIYVHTHGGDLYFGDRMSEQDLTANRKLVVDKLIRASKKNPRIVIGLENLPLFPNSDDPALIPDPEKVGRTVFEKLEDYSSSVNGTDVRLTFDSAHFAYDLSEGQIDLVSAINIFGEKLRHLHISDARGTWIPYKSVAGDGFVPGEGKIGVREFERFFKYMRENYDLSKVSIEAEIQDSDYSNPVNRIEGLRRIVQWLE